MQGTSHLPGGTRVLDPTGLRFHVCLARSWTGFPWCRARLASFCAMPAPAADRGCQYGRVAPVAPQCEAFSNVFGLFRDRGATIQWRVRHAANDKQFQECGARGRKGCGRPLNFVMPPSLFLQPHRSHCRGSRCRVPEPRKGSSPIGQKWV
eukprot:6383057-Prymnesium_polylepis.1